MEGYRVRAVSTNYPRAAGFPVGKEMNGVGVSLESKRLVQEGEKRRVAGKSTDRRGREEGMGT